MFNRYHLRVADWIDWLFFGSGIKKKKNFKKRGVGYLKKYIYYIYIMYVNIYVYFSLDCYYELSPFARNNTNVM